MPADASVYANFRPTDFGEAISRGYQIRESRARLSDLAKAREDQDAYKQAISKNIGEDGSLNPAVVSDLAKIGQGDKAYEIKGMIAEQAAKAQKNKEDLFHRKISVVGGAMDSLAGMPVDQRAVEYPKVRARLLDAGLIDPKDSPEQYDDGYFRQAYGDYRNTKDYLEKEKIKGETAKLYAEATKSKGEKSTQGFDLTSKLRGERSGLPTTKATQDVSAAYNKMVGAAKGNSAASDMSLVYGFMKMQDPGSTVREGEYASAENARGVVPGVMNLYNKLRTGERLTDAQRQDFLTQAGSMYNAQLDQQKKVDEGFKRLALKNGLSPDDVLLNFEANGVEPVGQKLGSGKEEKNSGGLIKEAKAAKGWDSVETNPKYFEALKFIKANPNHPRAKEILEKLKGGS